jgi:hypothetical protein
MYHALVRRYGVWESAGVHVPSSAWSNNCQTLVKAHGADNVACLYWDIDERLGKVGDLQRRISDDTTLANTAQRIWDDGGLMDAADNKGDLILSRAVMLLRVATAPRQPYLL